MKKKEKPTVIATEIATPKRRPGRPSKGGKRVGRAYNVFFDLDLWEQLEAYQENLIAEGKPSGDYKEHIQIALTEYLRKRDFWPPPSK